FGEAKEQALLAPVEIIGDNGLNFITKMNLMYLDGGGVVARDGIGALHMFMKHSITLILHLFLKVTKDAAQSWHEYINIKISDAVIIKTHAYSFTYSLFSSPSSQNITLWLMLKGHNILETLLSVSMEMHHHLMECYQWESIVLFLWNITGDERWESNLGTAGAMRDDIFINNISYVFFFMIYF
ncbi:hypothetical protein ACJX0J_029933, partial [Zea mays]